VYVASHNYGRFVGDAIESVLRQSIDGWELLVIDDGSTDNTREVMSKICDVHPCITYLRIPHTGCVGMVRNFGVKISTGKFIAYLDSDDKYLPCHLSKVYERFMSTDAMIVRTQSHFCRLRVMPDGSIRETEETDFGKAVYDRWNTYTSSRAYRRELLDYFVPDIYPEQHWPMAAKCMGEDELFYDVVEKLGVQVGAIEEPTIMYGLIYKGNNVTYNVPVIAAAYRDREIPNA
jgi:glycosyltransferase involved in cell wall biosynthesis